MLKIFIKKNAKIDVKDSLGKTPLYYAASHGTLIAYFQTNELFKQLVFFSNSRSFI